MDYNILENLSSLTDEEFQSLVENYDSLKMSTLSVEEQQEIRRMLKEEAYRRMNLSAHYDVGRENVIEKINLINQRLNLLQQATGGDYEKFPGIYQDVLALESELKSLTEKLEMVDKKIASNDSKIDNITEIAQKTKLSIAKKRIENGKKAVFVTAPQKICDLGKGLLTKIKGTARKFESKVAEYCQKIESSPEKVETKFDDYMQKNEESLLAIDEAMNNLLNDLDVVNNEKSGYEKYVMQNEIKKSLESEKRRYEKVAAKRYIVAKLKPGVVRLTRLPATIINKLSNRKIVSPAQSVIGM